jgi:hypothetical protein
MGAPFGTIVDGFVEQPSALAVFSPRLRRDLTAT